jgi:hypothetical protein
LQRSALITDRSDGLACAAPRKPTLSFDTPILSGALDAKAVSVVVKRSKPALLGCYKKLLAKVPGLEGTAVASFTIGADGKVTAATAPGIADPVEACIVATISKLRFARPKDGQPVLVTYPLTYDHGEPAGPLASITGATEPGGDGTIGLGSIDTIGHGGTGYGRAGGARTRSSRLSVEVGEPTVTGDLAKAIVRRYLRHNALKLSSCYDKELMVDRTLRGTATSTFTIGSDGIVRSSTASGLGNTHVESCVAGVIEAIEFPRPKTGEAKVTSPLRMKPVPEEPATPAATK